MKVKHAAASQVNSRTFTLRGNQVAPVTRLGPVDAAAFCVAGVALALCGTQLAAWVPLTPRHFAWQVWHLQSLTFTLRGRGGTWRHRRSICVASVALGDMDLHFAWHAWHLWHSAGSCDALGSR
eukprot:s1864_g29.t1